MNDTAPAITALAPWYGSKRTLAPRIVEALGPHRAYWEPFCGSMAVLLAKPPVAMETVNDLHGDLTNLAWVIQSPRHGSLLYRRLRRTWMTEALFAESVDRMRRPADFSTEAARLERAYWFFAHSWLGRNGLVGTRDYNNSTLTVRYTQNGGHSGTRWAAAVRSIPQWRERLRGVQILCRDGFEILARIEDAPGCAIYVDPPYLVKSCLYKHDFAAEDHTRLAAALRRFTRARVVVSYYQHARLAELYPPDRWHREEIVMQKAMSKTGGNPGGAARAPKSMAVEVLLCNQPLRPAAQDVARLF